MKKVIKIWFCTTVIMGLIFMIMFSISKTIAQQTSGIVNDIDGNVYHTIKIGTQVWMVENLKTTRFNDGETIPLVTDNSSWVNLSTPGYCWFNNDAGTFKNTYGALYNWFAVNTDKLAPSGWHVPTDAEWKILTDFLGGEDVAGGKMKEEGTAHWLIPNKGADNSSVFTALPCGERVNEGIYYNLGQVSHFWSSSQPDDPLFAVKYAWSRLLFNNSACVGRSGNIMAHGFSVRCVQNK